MRWSIRVWSCLHNVSGNMLFAVSNDLVCLPDVVSSSVKIVITERIFLWLIDWLRTGIWRVLLKFKRSIFCSWILDSSMSCPCGSAFSSFSLYRSCHFLVFQGTPWLNDGWMLWSQFVAMELLFSLVILSVPCKTVGGLEARATEAFCIYHNFVLEGISY